MADQGFSFCHMGRAVSLIDAHQHVAAADATAFLHGNLDNPALNFGHHHYLALGFRMAPRRNIAPMRLGGRCLRTDRREGGFALYIVTFGHGQRLISRRFTVRRAIPIAELTAHYPAHRDNGDGNGK